MVDYWNHNIAFHAELLNAVPRYGDVLDVGCGDGLLVEKLSAKSTRVIGLDPDPHAINRAQRRLANTPNSQVVLGSFLTAPELEGRSFDLITCVATLHHMPLVAALEQMNAKLKPGGRLFIVGLSANKTAWDWIVSGVQVLPIRLLSTLRGESGYPGMTVARPSESLTEIRRISRTVLPGRRVRRRFWYRYTLIWTKPE
jgi:2-polyprenyl-3-methyl-5-hydroxy-6-metoxy-1,4-benzoquinol methylase